VRAENFIYFAVVSGFFIGIIYSVACDFTLWDFIFATIIITLLFYAIALGSVAFYVKYYDIKKRLYLNVKEIEEVIDHQIEEMEKFENFIFESYKFIEQVEKEELEIIRKNKS
jgi:predicted neutral ceramidase superfamily lipid hydrolase